MSQLSASLIIFSFWLGFVVGLSFLIDWLWRQSTLGWRYHLIVAPGVIVHELGHLIGCAITGARVSGVTFFSRNGGEVKHGSPFIPIIGLPVIALMPLVSGIALLWLVSRLFGYVAFLPDLGHTLDIWQELVLMFHDLVTLFGYAYREWEFWLFVYLAVSITMTLSPSWQDTKNAAALVIVLPLLGVVLVHFGYGSSIAWVLRELSRLLAIGVSFEIIGLVVTIPFWVMKGYDLSRPLA